MLFVYHPAVSVQQSLYIVSIQQDHGITIQPQTKAPNQPTNHHELAGSELHTSQL